MPQMPPQMVGKGFTVLQKVKAVQTFFHCGDAGIYGMQRADLPGGAPDVGCHQRELIFQKRFPCSFVTCGHTAGQRFLLLGAYP